MADNADGKIVIKAELKDAKLVKGLRAVGAVAKTTMKATALAIAGIATGIGAGIGAVGKFANTYAKQADEIDKGSLRLGISKKAYQEWKYVIEKCGGSIDSLEMGMKTLNDVVIRVKDGEDSAIETMAKLQKASGKQIDLNADQETQLNQVVNALASVEDAQLRASLATDLLGRAGIDLLPTLASGTTAIDDLKQQAHELGLVMDDEAVSAGVALGDSWSDLTKKAGMVINEGIAPIIPNLQKLADAFTNSMNGTEGASEELSKALYDTISSGVKVVTDHLPELLNLGGQVVLALADGILASIPELAGNIPQVIEAIVNAVIVLAPKMLDAGVAIVKGLWDGIMQYKDEFIQVGSFLIDGLVEGIKTLASKPVEAIKSVGSSMLNSVKNLFGIHSPSREMMTIGQYLDRGLAKGIMLENGKVISASKAQAMGIKQVFVDMAEDGTVLGSAVSSKVLDGTIEKTKSIKDMWADTFQAMGEDCKIATESMFAGLTDVGTAIANGEDGWRAFGKAGLEALAKLLQSLGMELAVMAVSAYPNFAQMALAGAMSAVAMVSAGIVQGFADKFATGGIVQHKSGIPDTGDKQLVGVNAGELILNRAQQGVIASQLAGAGAGGGTINLSFSFGAGYSSDEVTQRIYSSINQMQRRGILPAWSVR